MLTIKQINEDKEAVIRGLEKKKFTEAREAIDAVLAADGKRKSAQTELDAVLAEQKTLAKEYRCFMKPARRKRPKRPRHAWQNSRRAAPNSKNSKKRPRKSAHSSSIRFPTSPYELVPEGTCAEDNVVVKTGGQETTLPVDPCLTGSWPKSMISLI